MPMNASDIEKLIKDRFPGAEVTDDDQGRVVTIEEWLFAIADCLKTQGFVATT